MDIRLQGPRYPLVGCAGGRATQEAKAEDAYMDVGVRQRLEHVVEQLPSDRSPFISPLLFTFD